MIQLRTSTLQDDFDFICDSDPALDTEREDFEAEMERFRDTGKDAPIREGQEPTIFKLQPIKSNRCLAMLNDLLGKEGAVTYFYQAAALGLVGVSNLPGFKVERIRGASGFDQVDVECLDKLPLAVIVELGKAVVEQSNPNPA